MDPFTNVEAPTRLLWVKCRPLAGVIKTAHGLLRVFCPTLILIHLGALKGGKVRKILRAHDRQAALPTLHKNH